MGRLVPPDDALSGIFLRASDLIEASKSASSETYIYYVSIHMNIHIRPESDSDADTARLSC